MNITLLKIGGSLITNKNKAYTLRTNKINQIVDELKQITNKYPKFNLILGNGAGSFAHQSAKKYSTHLGFSNKQSALGACIVHNDAEILNAILIKKCLAAKIPVYSLHPSSFIYTDNKRAKDYFLDSFDILLKRKMIPFIFGDVILDSSIGCTILSTDTLFRIISENLVKKGHSISIIHIGNYKGVIDKNKKVISKITPKTLRSIIDNLVLLNNIDVTGGMKLKVYEMIELAKKGITSHIIDGNIRGNIEKVLTNQNIGTCITK